jgi:hypothetical protein
VTAHPAAILADYQQTSVILYTNPDLQQGAIDALFG